MSEHIREAIYSPDSGSGLGLAIWRDMLRDSLRSRELVWRLFVRNFAARYRQSLLGYVWAVLPAIVTVFTATYVKSSQVVPIPDTDIAYPVYVLLGMTVWQLFSGGLTSTANSLVAAGSMVTKINFARESLVVAAMGQSIFDFFVRVLLVAVAFVWFAMVPAGTVFLTPLALLPLVLMTMGLGFMLSLANGVFRDISSVLQHVMFFGLFFTPILYPPPTEWPAFLINYLNPVSPFVLAIRDLTVAGALTEPYAYFGASVFGILVFLLGWRLFHLAMPRIAERI